jgi:SAM-dependent methyltransferase
MERAWRQGMKINELEDARERSPLFNKYKAVKQHFTNVSFRGAIVLDVGGTSTSHQIVKDTFESEEVLSLNINPGQITGTLASVVGDASSIPFQDESLDVVASFDTIEHLLIPDDFLAESFRVLKKSGWLVIMTPNLADIYSRVFFMFGYNPIQYNPARLRVATPFRSVQWGDTGHESVFTYKAMKEILVLKGFAIHGSYGFSTIDELENTLREGRCLTTDETLRTNLTRFSRTRKLLGRILPAGLNEGMVFIARKQ